MAKISFNKLNAKINTNVVEIAFNNVSVEIKQYLPIQEKSIIVQNIIEKAVANNEFYYNPIEIKVAKTMEIIKKYTNISFTEKQEQEMDKLYDSIASSGLAKTILDNIPNDELSDLEKLLQHSLDNFYNYSNSIAGILQTSAQSMDSIEKLKELAAGQDFTVLKDILSHLG